MLSRQKADFSIISTYSHQSGMNRSKKQIIGNAGKKGLCQSISISRKKTCCHGLPGTLAEHGKGQRDKDASYSPTQAFEPSRPVDLLSSLQQTSGEQLTRRSIDSELRKTCQIRIRYIDLGKASCDAKEYRKHSQQPISSCPPNIASFHMHPLTFVPQI